MRTRFVLLALPYLLTGPLAAAQSAWHTIHNDFYWVDQNGERVTIGEDGNVTFDPDFLDPTNLDFALSQLSDAIDAGCFQGQAYDYDSSRLDLGAYGGAFGIW